MNWRIQRTLELMDITGKRNDPALRAMVRRLMLRPNQRLEEMLLRQLTALAGDESFDPAAVHPPNEEDLDVPNAEGIPYVSFGQVGRVAENQILPLFPFRFPLTSNHRAFLGQARSGKSAAAAQLVRNLPPETKVVIFHPENDQVWLNLALQSPDFLIVPGLRLKRNNLEWPPGDDPLAWVNEVKRNLRESLYLRDGSMSLLSNVLNLALDEHRQSGRPVTLRYLRQKLLEHKSKVISRGREESWWESLLNRVNFLLTAPMFDCTKGFDYSFLCSNRTLVTCDGIGADEYVVLVNDFLSWVSRHMQPDLNPVPRLVIVIDEVHHLTNWERLKKADVSSALILIAGRSLAKRRACIIFCDQNVSQLPAELVGNTDLRAVFNTIDGRDLSALSASLGINFEQKAFISRLPQGVCLVHYANPNHPEPFPVVVDEMPLRSEIDEEVQARIAWSLSQFHYVASEPVEVVNLRNSPQSGGPEPLISPAARRYLIEIAHARDLKRLPALYRETENMNFSI